MKNYRDSDYAVNKYASGIVYRFADKTIEITLEDYLRENPHKTQNDFAELKKLSDEIYLEQVRCENAQSKKTVSFHALEETVNCSVPSFEATLEQIENKQHRQNLAKKALDKLTETQRRRYILYVVKGLTMREIAEIEGVLHSKIQKSLLAAEKKMQKFITNK